MTVLKYRDPADGVFKPLPPGTYYGDFVKRAGDTMTGALLFGGAKISEHDSFPENLKLENASGQFRTLFSDQVVLASAPTVDSHAATKGYVDNVGVSALYTPTLGGFTQGNGTLYGRYTKLNDLVEFTARFTLGSTSVAASSLALGLPFTAVDSNFAVNSFAFISSTGYDMLGIPSTTGVSIYAINSGAAYSQGAAVSASVPGTWNAGATITVTGKFFTSQ